MVAERQGQKAARNMLGYGEKFTDVPFFWSHHRDVPINYVGHAEKWDALEVEGDIAGRDRLLRFKRNGHVLAVALPPSYRGSHYGSRDRHGFA